MSIPAACRLACFGLPANICTASLAIESNWRGGFRLLAMPWKKAGGNDGSRQDSAGTARKAAGMMGGRKGLERDEDNETLTGTGTWKHLLKKYSAGAACWHLNPI